AGDRTAARLRGQGSATGGQRRPVRPTHRHRVPGAAPPGERRPDPRHLVGGRRTPPPHLPTHHRRTAQTAHRAQRLARVRRRRHRPTGGGAVASHPLIEAHLSTLRRCNTVRNADHIHVLNRDASSSTATTIRSSSSSAGTPKPILLIGRYATVPLIGRKSSYGGPGMA